MQSLASASVVAAVLVVLAALYLLARMLYKKVGPDEAMIVYGRRKIFGDKVRNEQGAIEGFRIVRGGGTLVLPVTEQFRVISLRMMTLDIDLQHVYTSQG